MEKREALWPTVLTLFVILFFVIGGIPAVIMGMSGDGPRADRWMGFAVLIALAWALVAYWRWSRQARRR